MADLENVKKQFPKLTDAQIINLLNKQVKSDERTKYYGLRKRISDRLYILKAKKAGIKVSKEEVDREMKVRGHVE